MLPPALRAIQANLRSRADRSTRQARILVELDLMDRLVEQIERVPENWARL